MTLDEVIALRDRVHELIKNSAGGEPRVDLSNADWCFIAGGGSINGLIWPHKVYSRDAGIVLNYCEERIDAMRASVKNAVLRRLRS